LKARKNEEETSAKSSSFQKIIIWDFELLTDTGRDGRGAVLGIQIRIH
jgi:hypothetical protein